MPRNLRLTIQYVGTRYSGWQSQPAGDTIQDLVQDALGRILGDPIRLIGAGRTDAGVHARGQVANFLTGSGIDLNRLRRGGNALLPADIRLADITAVDTAFHANHDARWKHYTYRFAVGEVVSPFVAPFVHPVRGRLEVDRMRAAAGAFVGEHDFTSFCAAACRVKDRVRRIGRSELVTENGDGVLAYRVVGNGFLQHMVRTLAGTLIEVGRGRVDPGAITGILAARDRRRAGPCAPASGLTLEQIDYGEQEAG